MQITLRSLIVIIDYFSIRDDVVSIFGWIADSRQPISDVSIYLNSTLWVEHVPLGENKDVQRVRFPKVRHTRRSQISLTAPLERLMLRDKAIEARFVTYFQGREVGSVTAVVRDFSSPNLNVPIPPDSLQARIGHMQVNFLEVGWRFYSDLTRAVGRYRDMSTMGRVLDWGCGCGRMLRFLIEDVDPAHCYGCDSDRLAIDWMKVNMPMCDCRTIPTQPPSDYADGFFDLVYGISIFTHLDEPTQFRWLEELRRVTAPEGIVAVSVLSPDRYPEADALKIGRLRKKAHAAGFLDVPSEQRQVFAEFANSDYYRLTFHTPDYIERNWSKYFELVEYVEMGANSHQDLVIMRKKG